MDFEQFARLMAEQVRTMASGDLLEIAAGTGVVTRALARTLPASVTITATDINPAMFARARSHTGLERVTWQEADALALPFADRSFDCVLCQSASCSSPTRHTHSARPCEWCDRAGGICSMSGVTWTER